MNDFICYFPDLQTNLTFNTFLFNPKEHQLNVTTFERSGFPSHGLTGINPWFLQTMTSTMFKNDQAITKYRRFDITIQGRIKCTFSVQKVDKGSGNKNTSDLTLIIVFKTGYMSTYQV